jgi:hypothetical protein
MTFRSQKDDLREPPRNLAPLARFARLLGRLAAREMVENVREVAATASKEHLDGQVEGN